MRLTIFAATGGIGREMLVQALAAGHDVTAVARRPEQLAGLGVRVVGTDLADADPAVLRSAVGGADAVLSGLGARTAGDAAAGVVRRGTQAIIKAMQETGVRRLVVVSAASVGTVASPGRPHPPRYNPGDGLVMRHVIAPIAKALFRRQYADLALMEDAVRASGLDWTISRPPRLLDRRLRRRYRTAYEKNVRTGMFIARSDVAAHMLAVAAQPATVGHVIGIAY